MILDNSKDMQKKVDWSLIWYADQSQSYFILLHIHKYSCSFNFFWEMDEPRTE